MKVFSSFLSYIPVIIFWLLVWELADFLIAGSIIIVSPRVTFMRLFQLAQTFVFWSSIGTSLGRIVYGFGLALVFGIIFAAISSVCGVFKRLILPAVNVMNAIPIASFTVIALMAMRSEYLSVFIAFVTVFPIMYHNTYKGIENTDPQLLEMARVFHVPSWKRFTHIYLRTVAPFVLSAATAGIGFAWKSGIAGELIGIVRGTIGANLHNARIFLQTADLFAWTIAIVLLSYAMERVFRVMFGRVTKWSS